MSGPYKMCSGCNGPGETCRVCPLEYEDRVKAEDVEESLELVTCSSDHGDVTGWVKVVKE